jgi:predicted ester cyclase
LQSSRSAVELPDCEGDDPLTPEQNKELLRFLIDEGLNTGNFSILDEHVDPGYIAHVPGRPDIPGGPESIKQVIGMWRAAFEDWHLKIEQLVADGDFVANRFTTTGTHTGPLMGIPPTGKQMVVRSQELHRFSNGKLVETWVVDDAPGIFVQLGIMELPLGEGPPS